MRITPATHDIPPAPRPLSSWARAEGARVDPQNIGFFAGAALASLDAIIRLDPCFAGAWRHRLALRTASVTARITGRTEGEDELRDAWCLRGKSKTLGPAGGHLVAWRALVGKSTLTAAALTRVAENFGLGASTPAPKFFAFLDGTDPAANPLRAAAEIVRAVYRVSPAAELLGLWLADYVLAQRLRWPSPLPLAALHLDEPAVRRAADARTSRPDDERWDDLIAFAYAKAAATAIDLAGDLHRRAAKLVAQAPKLRAKGAREVVATLLADDAIAPAQKIAGMSDRAMRRIADRLVDLGAVRELTRRPNFRLYGL